MTALDGLTVSDRERLLTRAREAKLKRKALEGRSIAKVPREGPLPLSYPQQRLWFLAQLEGADALPDPIVDGVRLTGPLNVDALRAALDRVVVRHEALRTRFVDVAGEPRQVIDPAGIGFALVEHDLRVHPHAERELERLNDAEAREPFDLARGPLIRGRLIRLADQEHVLLVTMNHIVGDGWSMGVLIDELGALYGAYCRGEPDPLPPLSIQYADYAAWQRDAPNEQTLQQQAAYWKDALGGAPALLELPTDHARPTRPDHAGAALALELEAPLTQALEALSRRHGTTMYVTLLAGWALLLARLAGQDEVVVGSVVANRGRLEIEPLVGVFVNTLALRLDVARPSTVGELLAHARARVVAAQQHQDISFEQVVEAVQPPRSLAHAPLFQVMFAWQNAPSGALDMPGLHARRVPRARAGAKYDLTLSLGQSGDTITGNLEYATALFEHGTIERYAGYWKELLRGLAQAGADTPLAELRIVPAAEREQLLHGWNDTAAPYPADRCIHQLFEDQVRQAPHATALVFGSQRWSYDALNRRANQVAHRLLALGVQPDDRVAVCMHRGPQLVAALLGVLKAGACYVPLDPQYPVKRLAAMLDDNGPRVLLVDEQRPDWCEGGSVPCVRVHGDDVVLDAQPQTDVRVESLRSSHAAYVIYTSGSTGQPKGVVVEHRHAVNFLVSMARTPGLERSDVLLAVSTVSFDVSVLELYLPLSRGATIVLARREESTDGQALARLMVEHEVTVMQATPATWRLLLASGWAGHPPLKILCGAEALTAELSVQLQARSREVWNVYGPTETTVWSTCRRCDGVPEGATESLGHPIANMRAYVLDERLDPVPVGIVGEIFMGGEGVTRGYLNRPELTAERFMPDPFARAAGHAHARMYRTGDLGWRNADGSLGYLGRNDFQIKIRGFRVEPGEIEACLRGIEGVSEAVVVAREAAPGDRRLVAYYCGSETSTQDLRARLAGALPEHMVPVAYVHLGTLPRMPNGKLDRRALPAPDAQALASQAFEPPQGEAERTVAALWQDLMALECVGRHDDFFVLGGHSLLAVQMISRLRQALGVEMPLGDVFAHPVLADFAARLARTGASTLQPIFASERGAPAPLSYAQQWFLTHQRLLREQGASTAAYRMARGVRLTGDLDREALVRALDRIVARHEALRTRFVDVDGEARQAFDDPGGGFALQEHDLRGHPRADDELRRLDELEALEPFDLAQGPLIRGRLIRLAEREHVLHVAMNHIVSDGWSMGVLADEFSALYAAYRRGEPDPLPALPIQYADYAAWQHTWLTPEVLQRQAAHWKETLAGAPALLALPSDRPRPAQQDQLGAERMVQLDATLVQALKGLGRRHGTTLYMTLLAGWALLLARLAGQDEVVVGTVSANRERVEVEPLVGLFISVLPLRIVTDGKENGPRTVGELLSHVKDRVLDSQRHQDLPFGPLVEAVQPSLSLAHFPIFQTLFVWQSAPRGHLELPGLEVQPFGATETGTPFDLWLSLGEGHDTVSGTLRYATALFEPQRIERYVSHWHVLLRAMAHDDTQDIDRLALEGDPVSCPAE